jgi:hypothetical protein
MQNLFSSITPAPAPRWKEKTYHITQTERSAIKTMLDNGWTFAHNRNKTKMYRVMQGTPEKDGYQYTIEISTRERRTIGADIETSKRNVPYKHTQKL